MQTMIMGKWPRGRANHRTSPLLNTSGRGQVGIVRGRDGLMRGSKFHGRGEHGEHTSTTIDSNALGCTLSSIYQSVSFKLSTE